MTSKKIYITQSILLLAVLLLAGCAAGVRKDDSTVVGEQALARWNLLIPRKADKAYDFLAPGYRATVTREDYARSMNNRPVNWKNVELVDSKCEADTCTVHLKLSYEVMVNLHGQHDVKGSSPVEEHWIRESGHWYVLPDKRAQPRNASQKSP